MLKKLLTVLMAFIIALAGQSFLYVSAASDVGRVYANYSFDEASSIEFSAKTNLITYETDTDRNSKYIRISKITGDDCYISTSLPAKPEKLVLEADINIFSTNSSVAPFSVRNSGSESPKSFTFISISSDRRVLHTADASTLATLSSGWNRVSIVADFSKSQFELWVNGTKMASGKSFNYTKGRDLSSLRMNYAGSSCRGDWGIDNLRIYEASVPLTDNEFANIWYLLDRKSAYEDDTVTSASLTSALAVHKKTGFMYSSYIPNPKKLKPKRLIYIEDGITYISAAEVAKAIGKTYSASLTAFQMQGNISLTANSKTAKIGTSSYTLDYPSKVSGGVFYVHLESFAKKVLNKNVFSDNEIIVVSNSAFKGETDEAFLTTVKSFLSFLRPSRDKIREDFIASGSWGVHPRLMIKPSDVDRIKNYISSGDAFAVRGLANIQSIASRYVLDPLPQYALDDRSTMLGIARDVLDKSEVLGMSYLLTGNEDHAQRLYEVLLAACSFPDWNDHNHYLDTGEMSAGVALGFDFIYNYLTPEQRKPIVEAIKKFSIYPGRSSHYASGFKYATNWNSVVNGGIAMAALAIADEDEDYAVYAFDTVEKCIRGVEYIMPSFVPDGAWEESSGYWNLAMRYCMRMFGTLECALGSNYYLTECEGFQNSGFFAAHVNGPYGLYNYHDASYQTPDWDTFMWFAKSFGNYDYAALRHYNIAQFNKNPNCYDLMYYSPDYTSDDAVDKLELDKYFRNVELISLRSTWKNRQGLYIGAHGGLGKTPHWNLDSGTFVLDALGTRFAEDLGTGNYSWDGYVNNKSYLYYLKRTEGQNCVVLNPKEYVNTWDMGQDWEAFSPVTEFVSNPDSSYAVMDLTDAYNENGASHYTRKFSLTDNRSVIMVEDDMTLEGEENQIYWFMHTKAEIQFLSENKLILTRSGKQLICEFTVEGADSYVIEDVEAKPLPMSPNPEVQQGSDYGRKISIHAQGTGNIKIKAVFKPHSSDKNRKVFYSDYAMIAPEATVTAPLNQNFMHVITKTNGDFPYGAAETIYMKFDLSDVNLDINKAVLHMDTTSQSRTWTAVAFLVPNDDWTEDTLSWYNIYDTQSAKIQVTESITGEEKTHSVYKPGIYGPDLENYVIFTTRSTTGNASTVPIEIDITELVKGEQVGDGAITLAVMLYTNSRGTYTRDFRIQFTNLGGPYIDILSSVPTNLLNNEDVKFKVDGVEKDTLSSGVITAEFDIPYNIRLPHSGTMVMAVYEGERLIGVYRDTKTFNYKENTVFSATTEKSIMVSPKTKVSTFFWLSTSSMHSMMPQISITANGRK